MKDRDEGLIKFLELVSNGIDIGIVLYNVPGQSRTNLYPSASAEDSGQGRKHRCDQGRHEGSISARRDDEGSRQKSPHHSWGGRVDVLTG